jgi:hypothetical protein
MSECGTACANYKELSRPSVFDKNRARGAEVRAIFHRAAPTRK